MKSLKYVFKKKPLRRILFDHIPKCGGTSVWNFLRDNYPSKRTFHTNGLTPSKDVEAFKVMTMEQRSRYWLVGGHGAQNLVDDVDDGFYKITMFRDPVDRIVSLYHYILRKDNHQHHDYVKGKSLTFLEFLNDENIRGVHNYFSRRYLSLKTKPGEIPEVNKVYDHIRDTYQLIGFLDEIESFSNNLCQELGMTNGRIRHKNKTDKRPPITDLSDEEQEIIFEKNKRDIELFEKLRS